MMGGLDNNGTHIYFVNSIEDPWNFAGMPDPSKKMDVQRTWICDCTECWHAMDLKPPEGDDDDDLRRCWYDVKFYLYKWLYNVPPPQDE